MDWVLTHLAGAKSDDIQAVLLNYCAALPVQFIAHHHGLVLWQHLDKNFLHSDGAGGGFIWPLSAFHVDHPNDETEMANKVFHGETAAEQVALT